MARRCELCGKQTRVGNAIKRRGLPKKKGGIGLKITGKTKRKFRPNIQSVRTRSGGTVRRMKICTSCLRSGRIEKA